MNVYAIIPAYQPEPVVVSTATELLEAGFPRVIVVDDGSTRADAAEIFQKLQELPRTTLLRHPVNRGKGAALRTGMSHILETSREAVGAVTVDADGQYDAVGAANVARELERHPHQLVLGYRSFFSEPSIPLGRKIGSIFQRLFTFLVLGCDIYDVQTGLRGIPVTAMPELIAIDSDRFEYEMEMIWRMRQGPIRQVPIPCFYAGNYASSSFHPVWDTVRYYRKLVALRWRWLRHRR